MSAVEIIVPTAFRRVRQDFVRLADLLESACGARTPGAVRVIPEGKAAEGSFDRGVVRGGIDA
jgi:hypothetical protein